MKVDRIRMGWGRGLRGQLDFSGKAHWPLCWARVRGEKGGLAAPWGGGHWLPETGAGTCSQSFPCKDPQSGLGLAGSLTRVVPFPEACPSQPVSGADVSIGGENRASCLSPKLPPGGGRMPGAHFNSPTVVLFYCSYLGFYYYCS